MKIVSVVGARPNFMKIAPIAEAIAVPEEINLKHKEKAAQSPVLENLGLTEADGALSRYGVVALHRPSNVDDNSLRGDMIAALTEITADLPLRGI